MYVMDARATRPRYRWVDNTKMILERDKGMVWKELVWLRIGTIGGLF
jgi:hypothetical protein